MVKAAFLSKSPVPVSVCDRVRLILITGGLSVSYCPIAAGLHRAVSHGHSSIKLAVFNCPQLLSLIDSELLLPMEGLKATCLETGDGDVT